MSNILAAVAIPNYAFVFLAFAIVSFVVSSVTSFLKIDKIYAYISPLSLVFLAIFSILTLPTAFPIYVALLFAAARLFVKKFEKTNFIVSLGFGLAALTQTFFSIETMHLMRDYVFPSFSTLLLLLMFTLMVGLILLFVFAFRMNFFRGVSFGIYITLHIYNLISYIYSFTVGLGLYLGLGFAGSVLLIVALLIELFNTKFLRLNRFQFWYQTYYFCGIFLVMMGYIFTLVF